jgi:enoyl-CoA hydratase/carnithine racemase
MDRVTTAIDGGVADVRLNRPDKLNALDLPMIEGLVATGERLRTEPGLRAVVLSGEGRGFCAGLDFMGFRSMAGAEPGSGPDAADAGGDGFARLGATDGRITHLAQQAAWCWVEVPVPVIAALHGPVLGGGLQIALGADLRLAAPDATMSVLEIRWGLIPDMTGTALLPPLVGIDVAKELTWTGRMVTGEEAVRLGLATRVSDSPREEALALARDLAARSPDAIRAAKRLLNRALISSAADQFAAERDEIAKVIGGENQVEAVTAYFEKREPVFRD